jgi:hypothetical protein
MKCGALIPNPQINISCKWSKFNNINRHSIDAEFTSNYLIIEYSLKEACTATARLGFRSG